MKRILVTGGAGFIGSHLCRRLHKQGNDVICLDNLYTGFTSNIFDLLSSERFTFIHQNIIDEIDIQVDQIYHLACPASPKHYQRDPIFTLDTNYLGSRNVLELAKKNNARVLLASTSEVYGDPMLNPQSEKYWGNVNPIGIRSCYDEGKRISETLFTDFHRKFNVDIRVARIFNTFGPNMDVQDGRVVSNFITQALLDKDITVYGDGSQTRSFCYVDDTVSGLYKLMETRREYTGPTNIGNPNEIKIIDLIGVLEVLLKRKLNPRFVQLPADDPKVRKPDITKALLELGWEPIVPLEEGLRRTIRYFENTSSLREISK
jgi:UDP-glucuronate decarboxylase